MALVHPSYASILNVLSFLADRMKTATPLMVAQALPLLIVTGAYQPMSSQAQTKCYDGGAMQLQSVKSIPGWSQSSLTKLVLML